MLLKSKKLLALLLLVSLLLAACRSNAPETPTETTQADLVMTSAATTANAQFTEMARPTATATLPPLPAPTATPAPTELISTIPALTITPLSSGTPAASSGDRATFWADVSIPDGTDFTPGEAFVKTWSLRNTGTSTWTTDYSFAFIGGAQMGAPASVKLTKTVAPNETVDISVSMTAPVVSGNYRGFWKMINAGGAFFDEAVYVDIDVVNGTPAPTSSGTTGSGGTVTSTGISVDDASPDTCPHSFVFTGTFTLSKAATVTYKLEAGSDTPGFEFNLPGPITYAFPAGENTVTFNLNITDSVNGWAQFHITAPDDVTSEQVTFSLDCDD